MEVCLDAILLQTKPGKSWMSSRKREICQDTSWSRRFQFVWTLCNMCIRASEGAGKREKSTSYSRMYECNVYFHLFEHFGSIKLWDRSFQTEYWLCWWWCTVIRVVSHSGYFTTCLQEEKADAFIPQNRKATDLELIELCSSVWIVQRWVITA